MTYYKAKHHRNTTGLSDLGKHIIASCIHAYVNENGQVIDPCHMWFSELQDSTSWNIKVSQPPTSGGKGL